MSDGTGRLFKRGNIWWVDYGFRGERYRESSKSTKKTDARKLLRKRMKEMSNGGPKVDEESVTFSDLRAEVVADYKANKQRSLKTVEIAFDRLEERFGGWKAVEIRTSHVRQYVADRLDEGYARSTVNKDLAALRRGYSLKMDADELSRAPTIKTLTTDNVREVFIPKADVEAICNELSDALAPVVWFAFYTGWRKGEIIGESGLKWRNVDFEAGNVRLDVGSTKNKEGRVFPFDVFPALEKLLLEQRERTDQVEKETGRVIPHVFHRNGGEPIRWMRDAWIGANKRAGLGGGTRETGYTFHDLRRGAVVNLEAAGVSRSVATKLTGHKTESVYRRYAIADETALSEGVEKLAALHGDDSRQGSRSAIPLRAEG